MTLVITDFINIQLHWIFDGVLNHWSLFVLIFILSITLAHHYIIIMLMCTRKLLKTEQTTCHYYAWPEQQQQQQRKKARNTCWLPIFHVWVASGNVYRHNYLNRHETVHTLPTTDKYVSNWSVVMNHLRYWSCRNSLCPLLFQSHLYLNHLWHIQMIIGNFFHPHFVTFRPSLHHNNKNALLTIRSFLIIFER